MILHFILFYLYDTRIHTGFVSWFKMWIRIQPNNTDPTGSGSTLNVRDIDIDIDIDIGCRHGLRHSLHRHNSINWGYLILF